MKIFASAKKDYEYIKQYKKLAFLVNAMTVVLGIGFMFLTVFTVLAKVVPTGSWINLVSGHSMDPTLHDKEIMFSSDKEIEAGDIVVSYFPEAVINAEPKRASVTIIKRVIGMPGDLIEIEEDGTVRINHIELDQSFISEEAKSHTYRDGLQHRFVLNQHQYFIMGDNRADSYDSRFFGPVNEGDILYVQSSSITSQALIKTVYVILYIILIIIAYKLIDFVVVEITYKILVGKEG